MYMSEGLGTESPITCTNGGQSKVGHLAERKEIFGEYQDTSPFITQSDSGAASTYVFSAETNNLANDNQRIENSTKKALD